jgi:predicted  nucleic acid-binding Zn-ribbon protein
MQPIIIEYIKTYDMVINMKNVISKALQTSKKENLIAHAELINSIKLIEFNSDKNLLPQLNQMTSTVDQVLTTVQNSFRKLISELVTSAFDLQERLKMETNVRKQETETASELGDFTDRTNDSAFKTSGVNIEKTFIDLKRKVEDSERRLQDQTKDYQNRVKQDAMKITELEERVKTLQANIIEARANVPLQKSNESMETYTTQKQMDQISDALPSIMFTRLDAERNAKRLKRAMSKGVVTEEEYQVFEFNVRFLDCCLQNRTNSFPSF